MAEILIIVLGVVVGGFIGLICCLFFCWDQIVAIKKDAMATIDMITYTHRTYMYCRYILICILGFIVGGAVGGGCSYGFSVAMTGS